MDIYAQHKILYKAYLLSRFADDIDNVTIILVFMKNTANGAKRRKTELAIMKHLRTT